MKKSVACGFAFITGLLIGSGVATILVKNKYEKIIEDEVTSARETYNQLAKDLAIKNEKEKEKMSLNNIAVEQAYISVPDKEDIAEQVAEQIKEEPVIIQNDIFEISSDEYGSDESYDLVSLNYYLDGILTDDRDEIVDDGADILGDTINALNTYLANGEEYAYVRNDVRRCDYEILLDSSNFYNS